MLGTLIILGNYLANVPLTVTETPVITVAPSVPTTLTFPEGVEATSCKFAVNFLKHNRADSKETFKNITFTVLFKQVNSRLVEVLKKHQVFWMNCNLRWSHRPSENGEYKIDFKIAMKGGDKNVTSVVSFCDPQRKGCFYVPEFIKILGKKNKQEFLSKRYKDDIMDFSSPDKENFMRVIKKINSQSL